MKTDPNCVVFEFDGKCHDCGHDQGETKVAIIDMLESGTPICAECGSDLAITDECEVRA